MPRKLRRRASQDSPAARGGVPVQARDGAPARLGAPGPQPPHAGEAIGLRLGPVLRFVRDHPWWVDGSIAAAYTAFWVTDILLTHLLGLRPQAASQVALDVLFTVLVLLRRHLPVVAVAVVALAPPLTRLAQFGLARDGYPPNGLIEDLSALDGVIPLQSSDAATLALLLYAVAAYRRPLVTWLCWGLATSAVVVSILVFSDPWSWWATLVASLALMLVAVLVGLNVRSRRMRLGELEAHARQLALERDQREQIAVSTERNRIAREMHDVVAHSLSVMVTLADGAAAVLVRDPVRARLALDQLAETGRAALTDTRRLVGVLREDELAAVPVPGAPPTDDEAPLTPAPGAHDVADLVDRFRTAGLPVRLSEAGPPLPAEAGLQLAVYRIVQECLTNVLRYARLSPRIEVSLDRTPTGVVIAVENDAGTAGTAVAGSGKGLIGIRERAAVYAGTVEAGPTRTGWRVRALLRWDEETR
ncbi:sensor histidine kinase [Georgenia sp. SYP-B2076]|uniref:sensor histidine kinase n=1 Tax=Georgenia sp. SYP-B2076 TaxID=2495881 RepID=UPI000F8CA568|nr:histidine kinase [Georgenia sp. SYP-B2076]